MYSVTIKWEDGHRETFRCEDIKFSKYLLLLELNDGSNRHIPWCVVRWFRVDRGNENTTEGGDLK